MSKLKEVDLAAILSRNKLILNSLIQILVDRKLNRNNWESWGDEFEVKMRSVHLMKVITDEWQESVSIELIQFE